MLEKIFNNISDKDKSYAIENVISHSSPRYDFFLLIILSVVMATFGLLLNSAAIIIGSMLIAPMLYPILSLSLGIVISDLKLISRSVITLGKSMAITIGTAAITTFIFGHEVVANTEILSRTETSLGYFFVAIAAGMAASFALIKPHLNESLPGVAISVALIPPVAVIGIGIAMFDWFIVKQSLILFILNVLGIILSSTVVFSLTNLYHKRADAIKALKKDDKEVAKEIAEANK